MKLQPSRIERLIEKAEFRIARRIESIFSSASFDLRRDIRRILHKDIISLSSEWTNIGPVITGIDVVAKERVVETRAKEARIF